MSNFVFQKKKSTLLLYTCLLTLLLACSSEKENKEIWIEDFPESNTVEVETLMTFEFFNINQILVDKSRIYMIKSMGDNFLDVYDKESLILLHSLAPKGEEPNEYSYLEVFRQYSDQKGESTEYLFDGGKGEVSILNFDIENPQDMLVKHRKLKSSYLPLFRMVYFSQNLKIGVPPGDFTKGRFKLFDQSHERTIDYLPELDSRINPDNYEPIYTNVSSGVQEDKSIFVATSNMLGQFDFFDLDGNFLYSSIIERHEGLKGAAASNSIFNENFKLYQTQIIPLKDSFFSLFGSMTLEGEPSNTNVYELDWEGNPLREYKLDKLVGSFAYDTLEQCFYGIALESLETDNMVLVKWDK